MHRGHHGGGGIEGVKRRALGTVILLGREEGLQFVADDLPRCILVPSRDRIRKNRQGNRPESAEAGQRLPFFRTGGSAFALDGL